MLFFLFGLSSYTPSKRFNQMKQIQFKILKLIPKLLYYIFVGLYLFQTYVDSHLNTVPVVEYISAIVITATHIAVLIDDISSIRKTRRMLLILFDSVAFLKKFMKLTLCLKTFERNFRWKLFLFISIKMFLFYVKLMTIRRIPSINLAILWIYQIIALFQMIFFIEFSTFILNSINQEIQLSFNEFQIMLSIESNVNHFSKILRQIKIIHFKMCRVTSLINSRYGWFATLLLLEQIVIPCIGIFFIFVFNTGPSEWKLRSIRNYFEYFLLIFH